MLRQKRLYSINVVKVTSLLPLILRVALYLLSYTFIPFQINSRYKRRFIPSSRQKIILGILSYLTSPPIIYIGRTTIPFLYSVRLCLLIPVTWFTSLSSSSLIDSKNSYLQNMYRVYLLSRINTDISEFSVRNYSTQQVSLESIRDLVGKVLRKAQYSRVEERVV